MKYLFLTIAVLGNSLCFAQSDSTLTTPEDSVTRKKNTLTLAAVFANDASYYGQRPEEVLPYAALSATYQFKSGIYLSGLAYKILNEKTPGISAANLGAGISWEFTKKLSGDLRYTHGFYKEFSPLMQAVNSENITLGLQYNSWVQASISGDYAFGETNDVFATAGLAKDIDLFSIGKKDLLSIRPFISVVAGTQRFYESYVTEQKRRDSVLRSIVAPIFSNRPARRQDTTTVTGSSFDLISYNFELPVSYSRAHYMLEAICQVSLLGNKAQSRPGKVNTFFTLSFYYQF